MTSSERRMPQLRSRKRFDVPESARIRSSDIVQSLIPHASPPLLAHPRSFSSLNSSNRSASIARRASASSRW